MTELRTLRAEIERVDDAIVELLARRALLVANLWVHKTEQGMPRIDPVREAEELARLRGRAVEFGLDPDAVEAVLRHVVGKEMYPRKTSPESSP